MEYFLKFSDILVPELPDYDVVPELPDNSHAALAALILETDDWW